MLIAAYPDYRMGFYAILSAVPDLIAEFPFTLFLLEYNYKKHSLLSNNPEKALIFGIQDALSLVPHVIIRVITNVNFLVMILSLVLNFTKADQPRWFSTITSFAANSNFAVVLFNVGLVCAHHPALRINWSHIKERLLAGAPSLRHIFCCCLPPSNTLTEQPPPDNEKETPMIDYSSPGSVLADGASPSDGPVTPRSPPPLASEPADTVDAEHSETTPSVVVTDSRGTLAAEGRTSARSDEETPKPADGAEAKVAEEKPAEAEHSISWGTIILFIATRHLISPLVMLGVVFMFPDAVLEPIEKHACVLITCMPINITGYTLLKEFHVKDVEVTISMVLQSFVCSYPFFLLWYTIVDHLIPL